MSIASEKNGYLGRIDAAVSAAPWDYKIETYKLFAKTCAGPGALRRWLNPCLQKLIADLRQSEFLARDLLRLKGVQDCKDEAFFDQCCSAARTDTTFLRQEALGWLAWLFFDRPETRDVLISCLTEALDPEVRVAAFYGLMLRYSEHIEIAGMLRQRSRTEGVAKAGTRMQQLLEGKGAYSFSQLTGELGAEAKREEERLFSAAKARASAVDVCPRARSPRLGLRSALMGAQFEQLRQAFEERFAVGAAEIVRRAHQSGLRVVPA